MLREAYQGNRLKTGARDFGTSQPPLSPILLQTCSSSSWVATAVAAGDPHSVPSGSASATALIIWTNAALVYNNVNLEQPLCHFSSANIARCVIPISSFTQMEPGRRGRKAALSEYPCIDLFACKPQVTAPAIHSIYVDMGAAVGLFFPLSSNSTSLPSSKASCNTGTMDAACSFFTAPHYCCSSPEKRLPSRDKLCAGSVICVSSNFPLIHLYILDGKHSLRAAINHAAVATKGRPASWGIAGACRVPGPEEGVKSSLCTCQRSCGVGADPAPPCSGYSPDGTRVARPWQLRSLHLSWRGDVLVGSPAGANAVSWPPRRLWMSVDCLKPATVLGCSLENIVACSPLRSCSLDPP